VTKLVAKLIDTTSCIGCKACEAACQEWNDQGLTAGAAATEDGTYQTFPDLRHDFWNLIQFREVERADGRFTWLMSKYQCMHCVEAGCLEACPAPGAIFRRDNGIVDFDHDRCIGCGYCITGCPFGVPKLSPVTRKVYKCTLCSDRTAVGLEPACIKACPTNCLTFGARDDLVRLAETRAEALRADGRESAGVYNPAGVGGTHVLYVLADASRPEDYGLPRDPTVPWQVRLWKGPVKWVGNAVLVGGILAALVHYLRFGPKEVEE
jgi:formate dehydrogenase beta subunit